MTKEHDNMIDLVKLSEINDTEDGGVIVSFEVTREMIHIVVSAFLLNAIKDKAVEATNEAIPEDDEAESREVVEEDGSASDTVEEEEGNARELLNTFWSDNPHRPSDNR